MALTDEHISKEKAKALHQTMEDKCTLLCFDFGLTGGTSGKELACQCMRHKRHRFDPWVRKIPWRRAQQPTSVFLPEESHGERNLVGYIPWGHKESDTTEAA